jgi:hypothetical protein
MLNDFIEKALAQIDDLAELKVTLVALRLLDAKQSETASVTEREMLAHAAVQSLSLPELTMRFALQKALSRGTLIEAQLGQGVRYFANNEASRRTIEAIEAPANIGRGRSETRPYDVVAKEIERLELVEAYALTSKDRALLDEWSAQGYSQDEILAAVREALKTPRPKNTTPRTLSAIKTALTAQPPQTPSHYYRVVVAGDEKPSEEIVALRELMRRWPNGREFETVHSAVTLFGVRAVVDGLKRISQGRQVDVSELVPLLAEQEDTDLAFERSRASVDVAVRDLLRLYESTMGLPPTEYVARDIKSVYDGDVKDVATWRAVFEYAARQNKTDWRYVRTLLLNPSPNVFMPQPANPVAQFAFDEYKRRVGRLDPSVANEINTVAQAVADEIKWRAAFDAGAKANALNWNYIKKVLTSGDKDEKLEKTSDGKRKRTANKSAKGGATYRREQVEYDDERRTAARERAKQRIAGRTAPPPKPDAKG